MSGVESPLSSKSVKLIGIKLNKDSEVLLERLTSFSLSLGVAFMMMGWATLGRSPFKTVHETTAVKFFRIKQTQLGSHFNSDLQYVVL